MDKGTIVLAVTGFATMLLFAGFSAMIKDTVVIWYQTRLFGLLSYAFLFAAVVLGEARALSVRKSDFHLFRYHRPAAIMSLYLVAVHLMSAFADDYKWGRLLKWTDYLGLSFSDKWLAFLSLGAIAFYLMVFTSATSATKAIQWTGYRRWKAIHLLTYASYFIAYVHSVNLGTDVKSSLIAPVVSQLMRLSFILVVGLLLARILKGLTILTDQLEVGMVVVFFIALLLCAAALTSYYVRGSERIASLEYELNLTRDDASLQEGGNAKLTGEVKGLIGSIKEVRDGQNS